MLNVEKVHETTTANNYFKKRKFTLKSANWKKSCKDY